jgi:hypothetical protein
MKWTIKLVAEVVAGEPIEHEIAMIERPGEISRVFSVSMRDDH